MRKKGRSTRTITAGQPFVVSLRTSQTIYEGALGTTAVMTVPVDRSGNMGYPGSVQWGVAPIGANPATAADFGGALPSDFISFGANELVANISITVHGNNVEDGDRTFQVSLNAPDTTGGSEVAVIGIGSIVCTILDDDGVVATSNVEYDGNAAYYDANASEYEG